jgi:hypothetical protein
MFYCTYGQMMPLLGGTYLLADIFVAIKIPLDAIRATFFGLLFRCQKPPVFHDMLSHSMTIMGIAMVVS